MNNGYFSADEVNIVLRKWYFDVPLLKKPLYFKSDVRFHFDHVVNQGPDAKFEDQRAVSKIGKQDIGFRSI